MARLSVLAAVAGALFAVTAAAQAMVNNNVPGLCNPYVCIGLAIMHSDCLDGFNPGAVLPDDDGPPTMQFTECVCGNSTLYDSYLSCYGFCDIDPATEPFCGKPVIARGEEAVASKTEVAPTTHVKPNFDPNKPRPSMRCISPVPGFCEHWDDRPYFNFCGVPGQACSKITDNTYDDADVADSGITDVTATAEAATPTVEAADVTITEAAELGGEAIEKDGKWITLITNSIYTSIWTNFCGVPGQACGGKIAEPTAEAGSNFVDVGDGDEALAGKLAEVPDKRDVVPTTLATLKGSPAHQATRGGIITPPVA